MDRRGLGEEVAEGQYDPGRSHPHIHETLDADDDAREATEVDGPGDSDGDEALSSAQAPSTEITRAGGETTEPSPPRHRALAGRAERHQEPEVGDRIGRFVLLERVGAGAVGVVYAAYDPQLDRRVAVKLLRARRTRSVSASTHHARLLREAQALARVSHPNVVGVHDVDTWEGRVYIAMEFVAGQTLRSWLMTKRRTRAQILDVFEQAGRGLAAAHAAGLIHRDFKPDNVVVSDEGVTKVLDFGLARTDQDAATRSITSEDDEPPTQAGATPVARTESALSVDLTRAGGIVGTPAYMAPEQHLGLEVTPRSDQFAFSVALYEALYGERPFAGESAAAVAFAVQEGAVRPPKAGADVPTWLRRVLLRGLATQPDRRWPDLHALLIALRADPRVLARRWTAIVGVTGLAALGLYSLRPGASSAPSPCQGAAAAIEAVWSPARAEALIAHFEASKLPWAGDSGRRVVTRLDAWRDAWIAGRTETCEATTIRGEQSAALMDKRIACLERIRREGAALIEGLSGGDAQAIEHAVEATSILRDPSECDDLERLVTLQSDRRSATPEAIEAIEGEVAEIRAEGLLHGHGAALDRAIALRPKIEALDDAQVSMYFFDQLAHLYAAAGEYDEEIEMLERALAAADRLGDDRARIDLSTYLVRATGYRRSDFTAGARWVRLADAVIRRLGEPAFTRANLEVAEGTVASKRGEYDEALLKLRAGVATLEAPDADRNDLHVALQALATTLREKGQLDEAGTILERYYRDVKEQLGPDHPAVATALSSLANNAYARTDYARAVELHEQGLAILRASFGKDSARYHDRLNNYAVALAAVGRSEEAEATHREILAHAEARYGGDDIRLTPSLENLGNVMTSQNRFDEARALLERSRAIKMIHYGADHPSTAMSSMNLGVALYHLGRFDEAEALYRETERVWAEKLGAEHPDLGIVACNLGDLMHARGRHREAAKLQQSALTAFEAAYGPESEDLAWPLVGLGLARLGLGDAAGAKEALDRAARLREHAELPPGELARMEFARAQATLPTDRAAALAIARAAREDAARMPDDQRLAFDAWLDRHGRRDD